MIGEILVEIRSLYPELDQGRQVHELVRRMIASMIEDVVTESAWRLAAIEPRSADAIRTADGPTIGFSPPMQAADRAIKDFLFGRMYRHERVMRIMADAEAVVRDLFGSYDNQPHSLPAEWSDLIPDSDEAGRARHIADFIAGMTDRYALVEHARHFRTTPDLR